LGDLSIEEKLQEAHMIGDKWIWEGLRTAEKIVAAESLRPAGHAFDAQKRRVRMKAKKKRKYYPSNPYPRDSKLHRLANAYRPRDPK
jgi:hypothetical protein